MNALYSLEAAEGAGIRFIGMGPMCGRTRLSAQRCEEITEIVARL